MRVVVKPVHTSGSDDADIVILVFKMQRIDRCYVHGRAILGGRTVKALREQVFDLTRGDLESNRL
jgi:hypothetical protein